MISFFKRNIHKFIFLLFIICLSVWGYRVYTKHVEKSRQKNIVVADIVPVFKPKSETITVSQNHIGHVEAINDTEIIPYISGYIVKINVSGGQKVKKGEVLAVLKQEQYAAELAASSAQVFSAKAEYLNAKIKYKRMKKAGLKAFSSTDLDNAKAAYITAKGALKKAKAEYFSAQTNFAYTYLTAPFDGIIGNIDASLGDFVSPQNKAITRLVQYDPIRVVFSISDKEYLAAQSQHKTPKMKIELVNGNILPQAGEIKYTANVIDPKTNSVSIYTEFSNSKQKLMPNAYVTVLQEQQYDNIVLLPKNLLQMRPNGDYVYTVINDVLQLHKLDKITEYQDKIAVLNNFMPQEFIVAQTVNEQMLGHKIKTQEIDKE